MNYTRLKIWFIVAFTLAVAAIIIRAIWQIVDIPTGGTMLIFIPLILALLFAEFLVIYLLMRPKRLKSLPFTVGITIALSAGLVAGVTHFVRFIISDKADPLLSKLISSLVLAASLGAYSLILYAIWSFRRAK
jgi:hypothetical protein